MASPFSWPVLVPSALRAPAPVNLGVRPLQRKEHMGILFLASLLAIFVAGAAALAGVVASVALNRDRPMYWLVSAVSATIAAYIYCPPSPSINHGGEYGKLANLVEVGFSYTNLIAIIGGAFCIFLARARSPLDRAASGASWAFLFAFATRFFAYLMA